MSMIEKAARAVMTAQGCGLIRDQGLVFCDQCDCHDVARAVLLAIREPSEEAALDGRYALCAEPDTPTDTTEAATACWQAMIDAILNEDGRGHS